MKLSKKLEKTFSSILIRLKNKGTLAALAGAVLIILNELGIGVDNDKVMNIINSISYILVLLGILNDSTNGGMYIPLVKDKLANKELTEEEIQK